MSEEISERLPEVPKLNVPCDRCQSFIVLENGNLPLHCPHCGKQIRPVNNSIWSHFVFVIAHRYICWQGRATRKELWSYILVSHFAWLIITFILLPQFFPIGTIIAFVIAFPLHFFLISIPSFFLIQRRLHDIGLSGIFVWIHFSLMMFGLILNGILLAMYSFDCASLFSICSELAKYAHAISSEFLLNFNSVPFHSLQELEVFVASDLLNNQESHRFDVYSFLLSFISTVTSLLNFFFLVVSFVDSSRGTNRFGVSRKYLYSV